MLNKFGLVATFAISAAFVANAATAQEPALEREPPVEYAVTSGPAEDGTPAWTIQGSFPDPGGNTRVDPGGKVTVLPRRPAGPRDPNAVPRCEHSTICSNPIGPARGTMQRLTYEEAPGYVHTYPYDLPPGIGGVPAVALEPGTNNLWVLQRKPDDMPKLFKFDGNANLILTVPVSVTGRMLKAHGMNVDADGNVWILDTALATAKKISPDGRLLQTIGTSGRRGDWNEAKGQRLLWEPVMIDFGADGDIYIAEGHGMESPNDVGSDDPANNLGNSRIIHLDKNGQFIDQYFGNNHGPGKFYSAHGFAVDPETGNLWIGDRENYRIIVLTSEGKFVKTMVTTGLANAIAFDKQGNPWYSTGQDGQYLKLNRDGKVLLAVGRGMGIDAGEFIEAAYFDFDQSGNIYGGDTSVGRVDKILAPTSKQARH